MEFALSELNRYTAKMGFSTDVELLVDASSFDMSRFFMADAKYDDAFEINIKNGTGYIKGTNERAVLIGVYHYLKKQGCRFLKPGKNGEYIPEKDFPTDVTETVYAKVRHRGTTNMDSWSTDVGVTSVTDYIDWLPKMGMNSFFIELEDYYDGIQMAYLGEKGINFPREDYLSGHEKTLEALKKRHILYHNAGHGWTIRMMEGIDKISFEPSDKTPLNPEILAKTDGKRQIFRQKPIWTNLCYSQENIRRDMAKMVLEYSKNHPETDFIHVWLADYFGNFCQCEECKKKRPSDWYVMLLNEIDSLFTKNGSDKKIVFLIYFELAYPPLFERINNPDRFVMMFAPYGRDFEKSWRDFTPKEYEPRLENNFSHDYMNMELYLSQLSEWKRIFKGDSFAFDYVFYSQAYFEHLCHVDFAKVPYLDCKDIKDYSLNGKIECGVTRALTPTSLTFHLMFNELFYGNTDFDKLYKDYFETAYGENERVSKLLERLSALLPSEFIRKKKATLTKAEKDDLTKAKALIGSFTEYAASLEPENSFRRENYEIFCKFLNTVTFYLSAIEEKANGANDEEIKKLMAEYKLLLSALEELTPNHISSNAIYTRISL